MTHAPRSHPFDPVSAWRPHAHLRSMFGTHRMRRGDIRLALLTTLGDGPAHGYELMRRLEEQSGGVWRPSPGSVYPTLQMLEDEGLVTSQEQDGKRTYSLTEAGRTEAEAQAEEKGGPFRFVSRGRMGEIAPLRHAFMELGAAVWQLVQSGDADQIHRAAEIVHEARRKLYQMLAE